MIDLIYSITSAVSVGLFIATVVVWIVTPGID